MYSISRGAYSVIGREAIRYIISTALNFEKKFSISPSWSLFLIFFFHLISIFLCFKKHFPVFPALLFFFVSVFCLQRNNYLYLSTIKRLYRLTIDNAIKVVGTKQLYI